MIDWLRSLFIDPTFGVARDSKWNDFRRTYIKNRCEVCGSKKSLSLHHHIPVHIDKSKELEVSNVSTLCDWRGNNCHLSFGHLGSFYSFNPEVKKDIEIWYNKVQLRP